MLITGEFIDAQTAKQQGLINRVASADQLDAVLQNLVDAIVQQLSMSLPDAYDFAKDVMVDNMMVKDVIEGIDAFIDKRPAVWTGC
ncbi:hypothetical protein [Psychrobacter pygoscelis]|uniref:hypothetical protein n=1 Tax=Psychrobacter pygoscelis TaxID=2488563 RepID=UPI0024186260|nr:hypothetical protein [Psychrobacter pygoscelis]